MDERDALQILARHVNILYGLYQLALLMQQKLNVFSILNRFELNIKLGFFMIGRN